MATGNLRRLALVGLSLGLVACSSTEEGTSDGAAIVAVTLSDAGCQPRHLVAKAGPTTFEVTNQGSASVTEFEVLAGGKILGEVENVGPGTARSFSLTLAAGSFTTSCPNGTVERGTLEVAEAATGATVDSAARAAAVAGYLTDVRAEADRLVLAVGPFADALRRGDIGRAKALYAGTRWHYEAIEPIAESFGGLDPAIDVREADAESPEAFTGFHRIERALWVDGDVTMLGPVVDRLVADVAELRRKIDGVELEPARIANGAVELLNEISTSKITGEEEAFSHTDLSDFAANLAGAKAAYSSVQALLDVEDAALSQLIGRRFDEVQRTLDRFRGSDPIGNGYLLYPSLTAEDTKALSTVLDTLAEPLSRVAAKLL